MRIRLIVHEGLWVCDVLHLDLDLYCFAGV